jgi:glycopeptide antibiotics resistance protein
VNSLVNRDWLGTYTGVAVVAVAAMPLVALLVWTLARHRIRRGGSRHAAWNSAVADVGLVYGTLPWVWMTLLPGSRAGEVTGAVSLVPFRDLPTMSTGQVLGNLMIFAAIGWFGPRRFAALASVWRVTALAGLLSVGIETAQYVLRLDRVSSVDDVLLNAGGAGVVAVVSLTSAALTRRRPGPRTPAARAGSSPSDRLSSVRRGPC